MRISVRLKPGAKKEMFLEIEGGYKAEVKAPAKEGRANEALLRLVARYFKMPISRVRMVSGLTARTKVIEL